MVTLVQLFNPEEKETSLVLNISTLARTIEASRKLPGDAGKFPPVASDCSCQAIVICRNFYQYPQGNLPAEQFTCGQCR